MNGPAQENGHTAPVHKWQQEFEEAIHTKDVVILCNNIRDVFISPDGGIERIGDSLKRSLNTLGYSDPLFYDPISRESIPKQTPAPEEEPTATERAGSRGISTKARDVDTTRYDSDTDIEELRGWLNKNSKKCLVIQFADETFPHALNAQDDQRRLQRLLKIIEKLERQENKLVLLWLLEDTIPPEFYKMNPRLKIINVPMPGRVDYERYFAKADEGERPRLVNIVDGLYLRDVDRLWRDDKQVNKLAEKVQKFKLGVEDKDNPWKEVVSKLFNKAEKFQHAMRDVRGQEDALAKVKGALYVAASDIQRTTGGNAMRPKACLFFVGPSGVGKTLVAQKLAAFLFEEAAGRDRLLRFDMSEYKDDFQVTRLYGSPPGYVGYDSGGTLTNPMKQDPFRVILFDEIEKADPRVLDIFLQILSDGRLTDSRGQTVYFSESFIIFTSNIGMRETPIRPRRESSGKELPAEYAKRAFGNDVENGVRPKEWKAFTERDGFDLLDGAEFKECKKEYLTAHFTHCVESYFEREISRGELLNRIGVDNIVVFHPISGDEQVNLIEDYVTRLTAAFTTFYSNDPRRTLKFSLTANSQHIAKQLYEKEKSRIARFGGRGVVNMIDGKIRDKLARVVVENEDTHKKSPNQMIKLKLECNNNGEIDVRIEEVINVH